MHSLLLTLMEPASHVASDPGYSGPCKLLTLYEKNAPTFNSHTTSPIVKAGSDLGMRLKTS